MMFPWNKMFPFPKEYMKNDMFKQTDIENWMNAAMKSKLPASGHMLGSTDFFEQSFELLTKIQAKKKKGKQSSISPKVFETHDEVYIQIPVPFEEQLQFITINHTSNSCCIENVPNSGSKHTIPLPCLVKSSGTNAKYKNGIVEVRIPKENNVPITKIPIEIVKNNN